MPDKLKHRGQHPKDKRLFSKKYLPDLKNAVSDLSFLLSREYSIKSALKVVGDRYYLTERQRFAVERCACSDSALKSRTKSCISLEQYNLPIFFYAERKEKHLDQTLLSAWQAERLLWIDGYNLLITIESALSGGIVFKGRDGCYRDIAGIHGTYRKVEETLPAVQLIGECLSELQLSAVKWFFDSPVSNSGRLKKLLETESIRQGWNNWEIELLNNPDRILAKTNAVIVSTDSWILDRCERWVNLAKYIIEEKIQNTCVIDLN